MQKLFISISICLLSLFLYQPSVYAAKPRVKKIGTTGTTTASSASYSSAKLSRSTNSVVLTCKNLAKVTKVTYELSYLSNGMSQGAMGSVVSTGQTIDNRDLYFGTCSHGVCTPHTNIKQATLTVRTQLKSGGTNIKLYRIKI